MIEKTVSRRLRGPLPDICTINKQLQVVVKGKLALSIGIIIIYTIKNYFYLTKLNYSMQDRLILYVAIGAFALISAITTFIGVKVIMSASEFWVQFAAGGLIALGSSSMMIYLGYKVPEYIKSRRVLQILFAYMVVATVSVFFNFCMFYSTLSSNSNVKQDIDSLLSHLNVVQSDAQLIPEQVSRVSEYRRIVADSREGMKYETNKQINPEAGRGNRFQEHKSKLEEFYPKIAGAEKDSIRIFRDILPLISEVDNELKNVVSEYEDKKDDPNWIKSTRTNLEKLYSKLISKIQSHSKDYPAPEFASNVSMNSSESALTAVLDFFSGQLEQNSHSRFYLSGGLALILDLPLFISLLILGKNPNDIDETRKGGNRMTSNSSKDSTTRKKKDKNQNQDFSNFWN